MHVCFTLPLSRFVTFTTHHCIFLFGFLVYTLNCSTLIRMYFINAAFYAHGFFREKERDKPHMV